MNVYIVFYVLSDSKLLKWKNPPVYTPFLPRIVIYIYMILTHVVTLTNVTTMLITMKMDMNMINNKMIN